MITKQILHFDETAQEAEILVTDGKYAVKCYAYPFSDVDAPFSLYGFMTENVMRAYDKRYIVEKTDKGYYSYKLQGELVNLEKCIVAIGELFIELEDGIPKDIKEHEFIEFTVMRIDYDDTGEVF